jgi:3-hydroxyisobutyrate dehydrogenase-like beta-hydroxyacid dehydrogenase
MATVAVLGTGLLGSGFVQNLLAKGNRVRVWNRTPKKLEPLAKLGATACAVASEAALGAERVHLILADDAAVDAVIATLRPGLGANTFVVDHSTNLPAAVAARTKTLRGQGVRYVHAPVFMSPQHAQQAGGLMLLSASQADADALTGPLGAMTGKLWHVGERADLAAFYKLAGNAVLVAMTGAMGDVLAMGKKNGIDAAQVLALFDVFKPGASLTFFGQRVAAAGDGPPSFELTMARKDVRLMLAAAGAEQQLAVLPGVAAAMDRALAEGRGGQDFAVFARADRR